MIEKKIPQPLKKISPFVWLLIAYCFFVLFYTLLNGYCKHIETYNDELFYYSLAEGLAKGMGISCRGEPNADLKRIVYSLLISPAFLTENRIIQFRLITLLNSLYICSGALPIYLLAKDVLKDYRYAFLTGLLYLIHPEVQYTASFMAENILLALALWIIFLTCRLTGKTILDFKNKVYCWFGWCIAAVLLVYVKPSGNVIIITSFIYIASISISNRIRNNTYDAESKKKNLFFLAIFTGILVTALYMISRIEWLSYLILYTIRMILQAWKDETWVYIRAFFYTWGSEFLAMGFFPMVLPIVFFKRLKNNEKNLLLFLLFLTIISNAGVVYTSVRGMKQAHHVGLPTYHRYVVYLWIPYLISFIAALRHHAQCSKIAAGITIALTFVFCLVFKGAILGSNYETSVLWWAKNWMQHRWLWIMLTVLFVIFGFYLLNRSQKWFICFFTVIMLGLQAYNHVAMHRAIYRTSIFNYDEIVEVENYITAHHDNTLLVVTIPTQGYRGETDYNPHFISKIADTYLLHPNSFFVPDNVITQLETEDGIDLQNSEVNLSRRKDIRSVDYVVVSNEILMDEDACESVLNNKYFTVFQLNDQTKVPYMKPYKWGEPGVMKLKPRNGFYSEYFENGTPTYLSKEYPAYVLYGPYKTLPAGSYTVTINYTYTGEQNGRIGRMDLMGSSFAEGEMQEDVWADRDAVAISFELDTACTDFEARLHAEAAGIQVESIEVYYELPQVEETAA